MADIFTKAKRSDIMSRIRSRGNKNTELALIKLFRRHRIAGWRRHLKLPGTPDFAFPKQRLVVFVNGCFWHGHKCCSRATRPKTNTDFWNKKISANIQRDAKVIKQLKQRGWAIFVIWQCQLSRPESRVKSLRAFLQTPDIHKRNNYE